MNKIAKYLNEHIHGFALSSDRILDAYSTDRSVIKIKPKVVVIPEDTDDIRKIVRFSDQLAVRKVEVPVTVRGAGRGKTGACLGSGIVISMEHMNKISEIDIRQRLVRCQAGVTLGQLNSALALHGLTIPVPADPEETIGGLIASSGLPDATSKPLAPHLYSYLEKAELVLPSGDLLQTESVPQKSLSKLKGLRDRESTLYRNLGNLLSSNTEVVETLLDPTLALPTGYPTLAHLSARGDLNLTPLLFGSDGSLVIITEVILRCDFLADPPTYFYIEFDESDAALDFAARATSLHPSTLDIYDLAILNGVESAGKVLHPFATDGLSSGFLVAISLSDIKSRKRRAKLKRLARLAGATTFAISTADTADDFSELHSILLTYLNDTTRSSRIPLVDGAYIPAARFGSYFAGLKTLEERYSVSLPIYGSYLTGTYSVRPEVNLGSVTGRQFVLGFLRDYHELLASLGGSLTGDTSEGRLKAIATTPALDPQLVQVYERLKEIFDPNKVLNPGVKHDVSVRSVIHNLRTSYDSGIIT